ncbi:MAG: hypothetical protein OQK03_03620 [Colwellia sp.]|nr:hypothetical protein [Colwellia sp.]MCW8865906.1 hypothetical protein [Colwellia sp.]
MLTTLPAHELIAFYAFSAFINISNHADFFTNGVLNQKSRTFTATLSLDEGGVVYENQPRKGCIIFNINFSFKVHQKRVEAKLALGKKKEPHNDELYYSYFEQIPPQIYDQALKLNTKQLSTKDKCLAALIKLYNANEVDIFEVSQKIMLEVDIKRATKALH